MNSAGNDIAHEPVAVLGRRFLGHRARHPVRARRPSDAAVVPQRRRRRADDAPSGSNRRYLPDARFPDAIEIHTRARGRGQGRGGYHYCRAQPLAALAAHAAQAAAGARRAPGLGHQGLRARHRQTTAPGGVRSVRRPLPGGRALRADVRARSGHGPADRHDHRLARCRIRHAARDRACMPRIFAPTPPPTSSASKSAAR